MRILIALISLVSMGVVSGAVAPDEHEQSRFQSFVSVLGPVSVKPDQHLKLCSTDISLVTNSGARDDHSRWSKRYHNGRGTSDRVVSSSTRIEVFDSTDTTRPLPITSSDLIYTSGKGACVELAGYDMMADGSSRSVIIVLTTLTEARAMFNPIASGQLIAPNNTSGIALLLPAVQSAGDSAGSSGKSCCACVPVCGCGTCD